MSIAMTAKERLYEILVELGLVVEEDSREIEIKAGDGDKQRGYTGSAVTFIFDPEGMELQEMWVFG